MLRFRTATMIQVIVFVVFTGMLTALVGLTFSQVRIEDNDTFKAEFSDASGLEKNVDVRGSGVTVGSVKSIERRDEGGVLVEFTVPKDLEVTSATQARIRYKNLTGDRYLELTPGEADGARAMKPGDTIPEERTQPALELDDLFAGFDPLMQALDPEQVNQLTTNILGVTQGQAGAYESMLANVGSFTSGLAERDELIGEVITNLSQTLTIVDERRGNLDQLVLDLDGLVQDLAANREAMIGGLADFSNLGTLVLDILSNVRPGLKANIDRVGVVAKNINDVEPYMRDFLSVAALGLQRAGRLGTNGSWFNFFLCGTRIRIDVPGTFGDTPVYTTPTVLAKADRCRAGANDPEGTDD